MGKESLKEKWYYDACVLDDRDVYSDIINKRPPKDSYISHLALGEAFGNCLLKSEEAATAFFELISKLQGYINIVGNDNIDHIFKSINEDPSIRLSITDAIHLATAFKYECIVFVTADKGDFINMSHKTVQNIASKFYPKSMINGKAFSFKAFPQKCAPKRKKY